MIGTAFAKPDITLTLDANGVIRRVVSSEAMAEDGVDSWQDRPWGETVDPAINDQITKMIEDMRQRGASSCFQIKQRLPSGRELPLEYTTVSLGKAAGFIAIGKNLQTISDLQARLQQAQQERERDYWKFREIETRYKMLFDASTEASVVVRVTNLRIVEANVAATRNLGLLPGPEFYPDLPPRDRRAIEAMLDKVREFGRAPGIALRLPPTNAQWSLRASLMSTEAGSFYLFQMTPLGAMPPAPWVSGAESVENIIKQMPDGFAIVDRDGIVRRANHTFLDLTQVGAEGVVIGQNINRWLSHPGVDIAVLLGLVQRHGSVRLLTTTIYGELGSNIQVEISAVGDRVGPPENIGLVIRDITTRSLETRSPVAPWAETDPNAEDFSLEQLVKASTEAIEQKAILAVLELSRGNRTAAAKRLGLSRQSLHAKLKKYDLEES